MSRGASYRSHRGNSADSGALIGIDRDFAMTQITTPLPRLVQEHLARQLRVTYLEMQDKPAYLGDPALPPEFDIHLLRLSRRQRASEQGLAAVAAALGVRTRH
jgi:hypothetical protein